MEDAIAKTESKEIAGFSNAASFDLLQRQAKLLASSELVPKEFQGKIANCVIALEIANRIGASPLAVIQNLYIVHGKPSWSSQFIIAALNSTGKFSPVRFTMEGEGDKKTCTAWAVEKSTGEKLEGPAASIDMAKKEGWLTKNGSKWQTMPDLMLRYRAATFFGRLYAPEILMGMKTYEEVVDIEPINKAEEVMKRFAEPENKVLSIAETADPCTKDPKSCGHEYGPENSVYGCDLNGENCKHQGK